LLDRRARELGGGRGVTQDDETCLKLGREIVRMVHEMNALGETAYTRRTFTYPGGAVYLFVANNAELAAVLDAAAIRQYDVITLKPPSQTN
jgi:hypothetical protein